MVRELKAAARPLAALSILLLLLALSGCGGPERRYPIAGTTHFPLLHQRTLVYRQTERGTVTEFTLRQRWLGGRKVKAFALDVEGIELGDCTLMQYDSAVVFVTSQPLTMLESPRVEPDFRQAWVDEMVAPKDHWDDPDTGTRTVFVGYEAVTVPAGTFDHCYRTVTEASPEVYDSLAARRDQGLLSPEQYQQLLAQAKLVVSRWFAPGVGLVKEQIGGPEFVRELVKVANPGRGEPLPPDYDPEHP